jgi:hypothetical protein
MHLKWGYSALGHDLIKIRGSSTLMQASLEPSVIIRTRYTNTPSSGYLTCTFRDSSVFRGASDGQVLAEIWLGNDMVMVNVNLPEYWLERLPHPTYIYGQLAKCAKSTRVIPAAIQLVRPMM